MNTFEAYKLFKEGYLQVRGYSSATIQGFNYSVRDFVEAVKDKEVKDLRMEDFRTWVRSHDHYAPTTKHVDTTRLIIFLKWLNKHYGLSFDVDEVKSGRRPKTSPKYITPDEVKKLLEVCKDTRQRLIISLLFTTGIRSAELRNLRVSDVKGNSIFIDYSKNNSQRTVLMSEKTENLLKFYLNSRSSNSQWVLTSKTNDGRMGSSTLRDLLARKCEQAGLPRYGAHTFRHGFATYLADNNMPIREVQQLLGHQSLNTTQMYLHLSKKNIASNHKKIMTIC